VEQARSVRVNGPHRAPLLFDHQKVAWWAPVPILAELGIGNDTASFPVMTFATNRRVAPRLAVRTSSSGDQNAAERVPSPHLRLASARHPIGRRRVLPNFFRMPSRPDPVSAASTGSAALPFLNLFNPWEIDPHQPRNPIGRRRHRRPRTISTLQSDGGRILPPALRDFSVRAKMKEILDASDS